MSAAAKARWVRAKSVLLAALVLLPAAGRAKEADGAGPVRVSLWSVSLRDLGEEFAIRARAQVEESLRSVGLFEVVAPPSVSGDADLFGPPCFEQLACLQRLGRQHDLAVVFQLVVTRSLGGVRYSLSSFSTQTGQRVRKVEDFSEAAPEDVKRALRWLTLKASSPMITTLARGKGSLRIDCAEADAALFINGKPFGKRVGQRFRVSAGVFEIVVNKSGFQPYHDVVMVRSSDTLLVTATLQRVAEEPKPGLKPGGEPDDPRLVAGTKDEAPEKPEPYLPPRRDPDPDKGPASPPPAFYETWWFWTIVGVGLAGAGGATAYFLLQDEGPSGVGGFEVNWQ